jgi:hypothetical protein
VIGDRASVRNLPSSQAFHPRRENLTQAALAQAMLPPHRCLPERSMNVAGGRGPTK